MHGRLLHWAHPSSPPPSPFQPAIFANSVADVMMAQSAVLALAGLRGSAPRALAGAWAGLARSLHTGQVVMHVQAVEDEAAAAPEQQTAAAAAAGAPRWTQDLGAIRTDWTVSSKAVVQPVGTTPLLRCCAAGGSLVRRHVQHACRRRRRCCHAPPYHTRECVFLLERCAPAVLPAARGGCRGVQHSPAGAGLSGGLGASHVQRPCHGQLARGGAGGSKGPAGLQLRLQDCCYSRHAVVERQACC